MTREEQIDWLCRLRADLNNGIIITPWNKEFTEALNNVLEQEPKTGHWIDVDGIFFECSECGAYRKMMPAYKEYYCPNCGAKMEGGD